MKFTLSDGYKPGHVEMFYGQGLTELGTLAPENPKEGDYRASFTVNGEWCFRLTNDEGEESFSDPGEITPELEELIKGVARCDGDTFQYKGLETTIKWRNNNWFEVFVDVYESEQWLEVAYEVDENHGVGPTSEQMQSTLQMYIDAYKDDDKNDDHRTGAGLTPCKYCGEKSCDYDCDESQVGGFQD